MRWPWRLALLALLACLAPLASATEGWHDCSAQGYYPGLYGAEAIANLTAFKSGLLSHVWASFDPEVPFAMGEKRYDPANPIMTCPPHRPLQRYGKEGGAVRQLCSLANLHRGCLVYSVGSDPGYTFERDVLLRTKCEVHTFDCTMKGESIHARHTFHQVCLGGAGTGPAYATWAEVLARLGHQHRMVDVLKLDIAGHEPGVLADLQDGALLPRQIAVDMHLRPADPAAATHVAAAGARTPAQMALLFLHMANLGYATVSRQASPAAGEAGCCAEFTLLHVEQQWAGPGSAGGVRPHPDRSSGGKQVPTKPSRLGVWAKLLSPLDRR